MQSQGYPRNQTELQPDLDFFCREAWGGGYWDILTLDPNVAFMFKLFQKTCSMCFIAPNTKFRH